MNDAGFSCAMQAIPAVRTRKLQANLVRMDSIHQRIKRLRVAKGLSQEGLAEILGVKYQSVQEWERENGTAPSRKRQADVAEALGVKIEELLLGTARAGENQLNVSARALDVGRRFDQLSEACKEHVSQQIDLLSGAGHNGDRDRAAQHDVVIKGGTVQANAKRKRRRQ